MSMLAAIAAGGAVGAVARFLVASGMERWLGAGFPWGTLAVNVAGSFALGALVEACALSWAPPPELRAALSVGALGAFTTFSAFSLDVASLVERGAALAAGGYVAASVTLSVGALACGLRAARWALA